MPNQQLVDYIDQCLAAGQTKEQIKQSLLSAGWQEENIDEELGSANVAMPVDFQHPKRFPTKLLVGAILGVVILSAIGGGAYWRKKFESKEAGIKKESEEKQVAVLPLVENEPQELATIDCGDDEKCLEEQFLLVKNYFFNHLKSCSTSIAKTPINTSKLRFEYEIQILKDENCRVRIFSTDLPANSQEMLCNIPVDTTEVNFPNVLFGENCTGSMVDFYKEMQNQGDLFRLMMFGSVINFGKSIEIKADANLAELPVKEVGIRKGGTITQPNPPFKISYSGGYKITVKSMESAYCEEKEIDLSDGKEVLYLCNNKKYAFKLISAEATVFKSVIDYIKFSIAEK